MCGNMAHISTPCSNYVSVFVHLTPTVTYGHLCHMVYGGHAMEFNKEVLIGKFKIIFVIIFCAYGGVVFYILFVTAFVGNKLLVFYQSNIMTYLIFLSSSSAYCSPLLDVDLPQGVFPDYLNIKCV